MLFHIIKIGDTEYKCKINTKGLVSLERRLKCNPLNIFMAMGDENFTLPKIEDLLIIFHESLSTYQHGISMEDVYDIFDKYIEDGKTIVDFINEIVEIFNVSGLLPKEKKKSKTSAKN